MTTKIVAVVDTTYYTKARQVGWQGRQARSINMLSLTANIFIAAANRTRKIKQGADWKALKAYLHYQSLYAIMPAILLHDIAFLTCLDHLGQCDHRYRKSQNRLLKVCCVPATSAGLPMVSFFFSFLFLLQWPFTVLIKQTRQALRAIKQSTYS